MDPGRETDARLGDELPTCKFNGVARKHLCLRHSLSVSIRQYAVSRAPSQDVNAYGIAFPLIADPELCRSNRINSPCRLTPVLEKMLLICERTVLSVTPTIVAIFRGA